jgi:hypothetical protein
MRHTTPDRYRKVNSGLRRHVQEIKNVFPKGTLIHFVLWAMAILYLLFSPAFQYRFLSQEVGKPPEVLNAPPKENGEIKYNLESLIYWSIDRVADQEGETYAFMGWAFINESPQIQQAEYDRFVVVYNESNTYLFPMKVYPRPDVQKAFQDLGLGDLKSSGFNAIISKNALKVGEYKIGLLFRSKENGTSYYTVTTKILERTPNHLQLFIKK